MPRIFLSVAVVAMLTACQSAPPPVDPAQERAAMLTGLGIDPAAVVYQDYARYAVVSPQSGPVAFKSGLYVQTGSELYLLKHQEDGGKSFERDLDVPLDELRYASVEPWIFTHLKQLHVGSPSGMIVVNFHDQPDAMAGDGEKAQSAYASLLEAKVRSGTPSGHVLPENAVTPYKEVYPAVGPPAGEAKAADSKHH